MGTGPYPLNKENYQDSPKVALNQFISQAMQDWCNHQCIELCWIEPGKPTQNAYIERFNGTFRREVLDAHIFTSIRQVRQTVDAWLVEYNTERPHQALQFMTPVEYRQVA